jgi:hypothetical protein
VIGGRPRSLARVLVAALLASLVAAVLGVEGARATGSEARITCQGPALAKAPKLPAGYPKPAEVTYVSAVQAGPSLIVRGYFAAPLDEALNEYKLSDAAEKITGSTVPTPTGLAGVFAELKATPHDLDQEAAFQDTPGTKRELAAFRLFNANRAKIEHKSPKAEELIKDALANVASEVTAGDKAGIRRATKALVAAVNRAATLATGSTRVRRALAGNLAPGSRLQARCGPGVFSRGGSSSVERPYELVTMSASRREMTWFSAASRSW